MRGFLQWSARMDSNHRPLPCQGSALSRLSYGPTCERLCIHSTGGGQFRQRLALSPSTRNHGLITGWKIIGVLSNRRETIASSDWTRNLISTVSRQRSNQLSYAPINNLQLPDILPEPL